MGVKDKVLVFMKKGYDDIKQFLLQNFECQIYLGDWGSEFPKITVNIPENQIQLHKYAIDKDGRKYETTVPFDIDWVFSWLSPWKIPSKILGCAKKGAINFHPGPPKYPGIGCYNYAIWNEDKEYAVTCHEMDEKLDNGEIITCYWFKLHGTETVKSLKNRAIIELKSLFYDEMEDIICYKEILHVKNKSDLEWGKYKSRKDFQEFCKIEIPKDYLCDWYAHLDIEILERKLRATYFKGARDLPYIEVNGKKWCLIPETDL